MYTCIAQNVAGVDSTDVLVEVYTIPRLLEELPPKIIIMAGNVSGCFKL